MSSQTRRRCMSRGCSPRSRRRAWSRRTSRASGSTTRARCASGPATSTSTPSAPKRSPGRSACGSGGCTCAPRGAGSRAASRRFFRSWPSGSRNVGAWRDRSPASNAAVPKVPVIGGTISGMGSTEAHSRRADGAGTAWGAEFPERARRKGHIGGHSPRARRRLIRPISSTKRRRTGCSRSRMLSSDQWKW